MAGLVEQLQLEALDPKVPVSQLLRRVKLVAVKLRLPHIAEWVNQELQGYEADPPKYRTIQGRPKAFNPYRGWQAIGGDAEILVQLSSRAVNQTISSLEDLVSRSEAEGELMVPFPEKLIAALNPGMSYPVDQMALAVDRSAVVSIIDQVRSRILDWALDLEREGILGEGLGFSKEEELKAAAVSIRIDQFSGNLATGDLSGPNSRLNFGTTDQSNNTVGAAFSTQDLEAAIRAGVADVGASRQMLEALEELRASERGGGALPAYQRFMAAAANHMTVIAPFLPGLTAALGG